jgi:spore coat protein H
MIRLSAVLALLAVPAGAQSEAALDTFRLQISPAHLDSLVETPEHGERYPGLVEWSADRCSCMVGLRGATGMSLEKKNFQLELTEPCQQGLVEILLNAEYRDSTLMRNCLGLRMSTLMGQPAPFARHAWLEINGEPWGVYLQVEEVDRTFMDRHSLGCESLFKSETATARLALSPADEEFGTGFEPRMDCGHMMPELERLAQRVCLGGEVSVDTLSFLDYLAVSLLIHDEDSICKNYFMVCAADGSWSYIPWDRDATFGNDWKGQWNPANIQDVFVYGMRISPPAQRFLTTPQGADMIAGRLLAAADCMEYQLVPIADSLRTLLEPYVSADPWLGLTPGEYAGFCDSLAAYLEARPDVMRQVAWDLQLPAVESFRVTPSRLDPDETHFSVSIESGSPLGHADLHCRYGDGGEDIFDLFSQDPGDTLWSRGMNLPGDCYAWALAAYIRPLGAPHAGVQASYPSYGFEQFFQNPTAHPSVVRAIGPLKPSLLEPLAPRRFGPDLWDLRLANASGDPQDLSRCGFLLEGSRSAVYLPDSFLLAPGDTLHLTNDRAALEMESPGARTAGNLQAATAAGDRLTMLDPGWSPLWRAAVAAEDTLPLPQPSLVITEVCATPAAASGDWLELYNRSGVELDLSGFTLVDGQGRSSLLPEGTVMEPWGFLVLCRSLEDFMEVFPEPAVEPCCCLESGLGSDADSIVLIGRAGRASAALDWSAAEGWPCGEDSVMVLARDTRSYRQPGNWAAARLPGSPGEPNPAWTQPENMPSLGAAAPCPASISSHSRVVLDYALKRVPGELRVYSVDGRLVAGPRQVLSYEGYLPLNLDELPGPGIYLAVLASRGRVSSARKLVVIP